MRRPFLKSLAMFITTPFITQTPTINYQTYTFAEAIAHIKAGGKARRKAWNFDYLLFEGTIWAFSFQGTGVRLEVVDVEHILAEDWILS